jgi:hypothetical protein
MGGIGIEIDSQEGKGAKPVPLTNLPQSLVDEVAKKLQITAAQSKDALATALAQGAIGIPENVDVKITRLSTPEFDCTIRKLPGGGGYRLTFRGESTVIR